jgi:hypothetical protein
MGNNTEDVILRFILDRSGQQSTKAGVDQLTGDLSDVDKIVRAATKDFAALEKQITESTTPREFDVIAEKLKAVDQQIKDITKSYQLQARVARAEAANITSDFEKVRVAQIKAFGDKLGGASRTALLGGAAILGGAFAESNRFAKEAEETGKATQATREWAAATKELAQARASVDADLLQQTLPLLQEAARIAKQAASFVEKNPEIVSAALKTGEVLAALGAVGIAVSKGIRLYADAKALLLGTEELAAAKLQDEAADKQLRAALLQAGVDGVPDGKTPKAPSALASAGQLVFGVAASAAVVAIVNQILNATGVGKVIEDAQAKARASGTGRVYPGFINDPQKRALQVQLNNAKTPEDVERLRNEIEGLGKQSQDTADVINNAMGQIAGSAHESEIVDAFQKWKEEDARIVQEAAEKRVQIVADAEKRVTAETAKYASTVSKINTGADKRAESITSNFYKAQAAAETRYQEQRAKLIRDGAQEIRDIQEEHQERLRKLERDHAERMEGLVSSRDALGLAREKRQFAQAKAEENRGTREEIAKRRQQLAERLQEMAAEHQAEQAQRYAEFQERLAENEAQRQEELKAAAAAHAEELKQIREQKAEQLRELTAQLNAERQRRQQYFIAQIRDLDATLLGERNLKIQNYNLMLRDAQTFFNSWRALMSSGSTTTTTTPTSTTPTATAPSGGGFGSFFGSFFGGNFASGGYASGIVQTGEQGTEFVLTNRTTRAAEKIIGGGLTQDAILSALARGGTGSSSSLTINDQSRFDGRISASQVREIKRETRNEILRELGIGRN